MSDTLKITGEVIEPSPTNPQIFTAINNAMKQIGAVGKTSKNQQQGFMFRGIDAVMNAINPALQNNGIFVVPTVLEQTREERTNSKGTTLLYTILKVRYRFYAVDGSFFDSVVVGEGMDSGDKSCSKALSICFKYACFQIFCIPTEDMVDPDFECHTVQPKEAPKAQVKEADHASAEDIAKLRQDIAKLGWKENDLFKGRTLEQLSLSEFTQASKTISERAGARDKS